MDKGIRVGKMMPGELVYLNLPYHPGNKLDVVPPAPPSNVRKAVETNMGYPAITLSWDPGRDDHWVSYYEVMRNSVVLDKVSKGTFHFDHSAGAGLAALYQVRTVNGAGLRSSPSDAQGPTQETALILDDTSSGVTFTGRWQGQSHLQPAYQGTISWSDEKGASFAFDVDGTKFTWFTKLGADCGKAEILIDGQPRRSLIRIPLMISGE